MNKLLFDTRTPNGLKHFQKQLDALLEYNRDPDEKHYNDIHIYQEEMFIVLEWENVPYSHEWGGKWVHLEVDEVVMKEVHFPDNHYEYMFPEEVNERFNEWLKENPEWHKNQWGIWTDAKQ